MDEKDKPGLFSKTKKRRVRRIGSRRVLPSGNIQLRVRGLDPEGKRFELSRTCSPEAEQEITARMRVEAREIKDGLRRRLPRLTLAQYAEKFRRRNPWNHERASTWRLLKPLHALPLSQVTDAAVGRWAYAATWPGPGRAPRGSGQGSRAYVLHAYELLRRLLRQAVADGAIPNLPCSARPPGVPGARSARKQRRPLTPDERDAVITAAAADPDPSLLPRVLLMACTGLRPVELRTAKTENLWPAERVCQGAPPGSHVLNCPNPIKGGVAHIAPVPPDVAAPLTAYLAELPPAARATGLLFPVFSPQLSAWVMRAEFIDRRRWRALFAAAGLPSDLVLYQLRHTRLTEWSNDTAIGARRAADLVGHADMRTTEGYAARARGLVPAAFSCVSPDTEKDPPPDAPPPKGKKRATKKRAPKKSAPSPRRNHAPAKPPDDPRLRALASRVLSCGRDAIAWELIERVGDLQAVAFADELATAAAETPILVDLAARIRALVVGRLRTTRPAFRPGFAKGI